jgi:hypothetical protein
MTFSICLDCYIKLSKEDVTSPLWQLHFLYNFKILLQHFREMRLSAKKYNPDSIEDWIYSIFPQKVVRCNSLSLMKICIPMNV